jgi:transcriptional regulator with XRE-family HTH domain
MEIRQRVGKNVRQRIDAMGLSHRAFAKAYGFPRSFIVRMVAGEANPTLLQLEKLARALNVPISRLLQ